MIEFKTRGQRQMFLRHLKDLGVISMEEYLLLIAMARGSQSSLTQFKMYVERMCAERPELAIAAKVKHRIINGVKL
jgi:hypothetical protein